MKNLTTKEIDDKNKILHSIKELFNNILIEINRNLLTHKFNMACECFKAGGLIDKFRNVVDIPTTTNVKIDNISVMNTYINFENDIITYIISSSIRTSINFKMTQVDYTIEPSKFWEELQNILNDGSDFDELEFLNNKMDVVKLLKTSSIINQKFEPAAMWRDIEKKLADKIEKINKL